MRKHTRGEWSHQAGHIDGLEDVFTNESEGMICQNARYEDARLIAAAPELLEALRAIADRADSNVQEGDITSDEHGGFIRIRDDARAAIAMAEGRA